MNKKIRVIISIIVSLIVLGVIFCIIDSIRVHGDEEPIFALIHKTIETSDYSGDVNIGLGYKIVRIHSSSDPDYIGIGTIFMSESPPYQENTPILEDVVVIEESGESGESGEQNSKITTFGDKYTQKIMIEAMEQDVLAQNINSKLGYSMEYYYELFDYSGFEDHDKYTWNLTSGDMKATMTIYDISNETAYKETMDNIGKKNLFEEVSGEYSNQIQKHYHRKFKEKDVERVNDIYILWLDDLKLMVDYYMPSELVEGVGTYMDHMTISITKSSISNE